MPGSVNFDTQSVKMLTSESHTVNLTLSNASASDPDQVVYLSTNDNNLKFSPASCILNFKTPNCTVTVTSNDNPGTYSLFGQVNGVSIVPVSVTVNNNVISLQSITITPANSVINLDQAQQFIATGVFSDGTTQDITNSVVWSSSSTAVAEIGNSSSNAGLATPVALGTTVIVASMSGVSAQSNLTVSK